MKITEAVYLAGIPVVGTTVAYLFEAGFAVFHGIPISLIQLSISQLVGTAVLGLLGLWMLHTYISIGIAFLARRKHLLFKFLGLGMLNAALPLLLVASLGASDAKWWIAAAAFFFTPALSGLIETLGSHDKNAPFAQRWWDKTSSGFDSKPYTPDRLDLVIEKPQMFLAASLLLIFLTSLLGYRYASWQKPVRVMQSDPSKAFIVVYGDKWFFRPIDEIERPSNPAKRELYILSGDGIKNLVLQNRELRPAAVVAKGA